MFLRDSLFLAFTQSWMADCIAMLSSLNFTTMGRVSDSMSVST